MLRPVRFDKVWFRYARRAPWTLHDIDATVLPGRATVVLGPNGAGKSTLLQLAAGVLQPSRGAIHDRPRVVGWVPERFPAAQPFSTLGYLRAMAEVRGLPARAADEWIDRLYLAAHVDTPLSDLSKGTAQKVGLAQALLTPPGLLILDEPWEGLDAQSRELVPQLVSEVTEEGGAVLVSDHRGEIATLPNAIHWTVTGQRVTVSGAEPTENPTGPAPDEVVVEVAVHKDKAADAVTSLTAAGHRVLGVRSNSQLAVRRTNVLSREVAPALVRKTAPTLGGTNVLSREGGPGFVGESAPTSGGTNVLSREGGPGFVGESAPTSGETNVLSREGGPEPTKKTTPTPGRTNVLSTTSDHESDESGDHAAEQPGEHAAEHPGEHPGDHAAEHPCEHAAEEPSR